MHRLHETCLQDISNHRWWREQIPGFQRIQERSTRLRAGCHTRGIPGRISEDGSRREWNNRLRRILRSTEGNTIFTALESGIRSNNRCGSINIDWGYRVTCYGWVTFSQNFGIWFWLIRKAQLGYLVKQGSIYTCHTPLHCFGDRVRAYQFNDTPVYASVAWRDPEVLVYFSECIVQYSLASWLVKILNLRTTWRFRVGWWECK